MKLIMRLKLLFIVISMCVIITPDAFARSEGQLSAGHG